MTVTPEQFLAKLAASPADAREFDSCAPRGMSRREHVEFTLAQVKNSCANVADSKRLAIARAANSSLKSDLEKAMARIKFMTPESTVRHNLHAAPGCKKPIGPAKPFSSIKQSTTTPPMKSINNTPAAPLTPKLTNASEFATAPLVMTRAEFEKLTPIDKTRFFKSGGKLA